MFRSANVERKPGYAQATLGSVLVPLLKVDHRIDDCESPALVLSACRIHHEYALRDPDLWSGQPHTAGRVHDLEHTDDQRPQRLIKLRHFFSPFREHGITIFYDCACHLSRSLLLQPLLSGTFSPRSTRWTHGHGSSSLSRFYI